MNIINNRLPEYTNGSLKVTTVLNKFMYDSKFDGYELLGRYWKRY